MKKRVLAALLASACVLAFTACGDNKEQESPKAEDQGAATAATMAEAVSTKGMNADEYVTIGEYEGMEIEVPTYSVSQEDIDKETQDEFDYYIQTSGASDYQVLDKDTVEDGDLVNIDYKGLKDGVAFDGGTAQGQHLLIGSGQFIDGFESGLIGHKVGEEVSLNLTFPEEYHSEELAGQAVVFEVKINSIDEEKALELTDEAVANMGLNANTVDEFKASVKEFLDQQCAERNESEKKAVVWETVYKTCTVKEPPQELVDSEVDRLKSVMSKYAVQYNVTEEDFISQYMGMTTEEYETKCHESAVTTSKEKLAAAAIAKKAGIELSDEQVQQEAQTEATNLGYESAEAMFEQTGGIGPYYDYLLGQKVDDYLLEKVTVKEKAPVSVLTEAEAVSE